MTLADKVFNIIERNQNLPAGDLAVLAWVSGQLDRVADEVVDIPEPILEAYTGFIQARQDAAKKDAN